VNKSWEKEFGGRMKEFSASHHLPQDTFPVSIKIRVSTGCYHRSCCPHAYAMIDREVASLVSTGDAFQFVEHESGPEILAVVVLTSAGLTFAASIINLVTAIVKARFDGARKGDRHADPIELVVRRTNAKEEVVEELVMHFAGDDERSQALLGAQLLDATKRLLALQEPLSVPRKKTKPARHHRRSTPRDIGRTRRRR
jgi:hypothetical protein